jgi:4-amino-4-deoxychorismate lyase
MNHAIFMDGRLMPVHQTQISPLNTAILYGEGLFETLSVYHGKPLFFQEHLTRLEKGCRFLGWRVPPRTIFEKAIRLYSEKVPGHFAIRFNLVQEMAPPAAPQQFSRRLPRLFAMIRPLRHQPESFTPPTGRAGISPWTVPGPSAAPGQFKWIFYMMIRQDFRRHSHWDEMLRLNEKGFVVDGGGAAPFWALDGVIYAPPLRNGGLESVTRRKVLEICKNLKIPVVERSWRPIEVLKKGELFFAGSGVGILAISHLMEKRLGKFNSIALRLWQHYRHFIFQKASF